MAVWNGSIYFQEVEILETMRNPNQSCTSPFKGLIAVPLLIFCMVFSNRSSLAQPSGGDQGSNGQGQTQNSSSGGGGSGNAKGQGGQSTGGQGIATPSNTYHVEIDMLAYDAAEKIAQSISTKVPATGQFIVYDTQTFNALQLYQGYEAGVSIFESGYRIVESNTTKSLEAGVAAAQTIVSTLAALRSTTEFGTQTVNLNTDALIAQLSSNLNGRIIVPKILLESPIGTNDFGLGTWKSTETEEGCADITKTVPRQLACVLGQRNQAMGKPGFEQIDKLFQSFLGLLLNINVSGNVKTPSSSNTNPNAANNVAAANNNANLPPNSQDNNTNQSPNNNSNPAPIQTPALYSLVLGRRLEQQLRANCAVTTTAVEVSGSSAAAAPNRNHLLFLETMAAGGSYRIRHNFWVELFWTTPTPSVNGGAVVTYYVVDPCTSSIETSGVLRYMFDYGKFKDIKPEKHGANFK